mmetsp:Transcript_43096/g.107851  ORF Transcript_43096/g.107851 Transcript_43096/m.107851 type:complete len:230 (-) Transcript_43096:265-954(-)
MMRSATRSWESLRPQTWPHGGVAFCHGGSHLGQSVHAMTPCIPSTSCATASASGFVYVARSHSDICITDAPSIRGAAMVAQRENCVRDWAGVSQNWVAPSELPRSMSGSFQPPGPACDSIPTDACAAWYTPNQSLTLGATRHMLPSLPPTSLYQVSPPESEKSMGLPVLLMASLITAYSWYATSCATSGLKQLSSLTKSMPHSAKVDASVFSWPRDPGRRWQVRAPLSV